LYWAFIFIFGFFSCQKDETQDKTLATRTIIAYIAADNDLSGDTSVSLQQMEQGFSEKGVNLIVFNAQSGENPQLLEIHPEQGIDLVLTMSLLCSALGKHRLLRIKVVRRAIITSSSKRQSTAWKHPKLLKRYIFSAFTFFLNHALSP